MSISSYLRACMFPIFAVAVTPALAGGTPLEAYSNLDCSVWRLEDALPEDLTRHYFARSGTPKLRQLLSTSLQKASSEGGEPGLFLGQAFPKKKAQQPKIEQIHEMGCIRQQMASISGNTHRLRCYVEVGARIETYAFHALPPLTKNELASYGCSGDCPDYPVLVVHEMPWEDGPASRRQQRASTAYAKRCL